MEDLIQRLKIIIIDGLQLEEMSPEDLDTDAPLFGDDTLGLDSIDALEIVMEVERHFGIRLEDDASTREVMTTVRSLAEYIARKQPSLA